jgi:predicted TIM-barrel fold metal-dependent hydrolase
MADPPHPAHFDTGALLANAARQAGERGFGDFLIVDADAHHYESEDWAEITRFIDQPVIRQWSEASMAKGGARPGMLVTQLGNQDISGRISRYRLRSSEQLEAGIPRVVAQTRRSMTAMGIDVTVLFPTVMLNLGMHPQVEVEGAIAHAYARWMTERILPADLSIKTMLYLPFNDPEASVRLVERFAGHPGVVGFMVTAVRYRPVHDNAYMGLYAALEERGLPLGFHAAYNWYDRSMELFNRFISVHAVGFPFYQMVHMTNWVINGMPERFPRLKVLWIEGGLAWVPFLMQRLDNEYMMRSSEAPLLRRKPSEYMREMYYTSQPMEYPDNLEVLETTFRMIDAPRQLLYASDYPHWDFDLPSRVYDLPFLREEAKRRILGENARELFGLPERKQAAAD